MSVNASSSVSLYSLLHSCFNSRAGAFSITAFTIASILLLPIFILVLHLGYQRWRQQRPGTTMSHSDIFTYHIVVIELMSVLGSLLSCCGIFTDLPQMIMLGIYLFCFNFTGQILFHILTCVERYLAVVHPITYLSLRNPKGIRMRTIAICCAWLLCFAGTGFLSTANQISMLIISISAIAFILIVISFCSLSVLCVLIRPGPGEGGGSRHWVDQSKLKAFYTITAILGVLLFRLVGNTFGTAVYASPHLGEAQICGVWLSTTWFCLPSSLVLPLLFLHRAGKLPYCKNNSDSGQESG